MASTIESMVVYQPRRMAKIKMRANGDPQRKRIGPFTMTVRKFRKRRGLPTPLIRRNGG